MSTVPPEADEGDPRPIVRTGSASNLGLWVFLGVLLVGGLLLFQALRAGQGDLASNQVPQVSEGGMISAPPPLALPPNFDAYSAHDWFDRAGRALPPAAQNAPPSPAAPPQVVTRVVERVVPAPREASSASPSIGEPRPAIISGGTPSAAMRASSAAGEADANDRVTSSRLANPALTIPQGTVMTAVLETALDSTRPGAARAIISRDVMSFDGRRVLVPRGSRLYGEYQADLERGQKRALIRWQRLTRPDAVIINLDSPSADPLGRAGVEGKVDGHFLARFGGAILQSVLDIGVGVATRAATDGVVVALPGSTQNITGTNPADIQPTLKVRQGTSVSVFVARDLDFSTTDR